MRRSLSYLALFALALALAPAWVSLAQDGKGASDEQFVQKASETDLAEINLGRVAVERAGDSRVKQFGQKMVTDHTKSSKELLPIADKLGLKPATKMDTKHEALHEELSKLKGEAFDAAYMKHMVMGHEKAVMLYRQQAEGGKDASLKAFAAKTLPVVQEHLKQAQALAGKSGGTTKER